MIILRAINDNGSKFDLDLFQGEDLRLDISAIEAGNIGEIFGISSQQFALPGTENNNSFFGNLYDLGATPATTFTKTIPCQVLYNGGEVFTGNLYLDNVITDQQGDTIYNVVVVNEIVDFKILVEDITLGDLDWSEYDHTLNYTNVSESFDGNLFNGDIVYPLVNYGFNPENPNDIEIAAGGGLRKFDNANSALKITSFKPAIRAKAVIDKIFESIKYSYSSSFFDSSYFESLYVLTTQDGKEGSNFTNPVAQTFQAQKGSPQTLTNNTETKVAYPTENFDNGGDWNTALSRYTADNDNAYTFYAQVDFQKSSGAGFSPDFLTFSVKKNGTTEIASTSVNIKTTGGAALSGVAFIGPFTRNLNAGDYIEVYLTREADFPGSSTVTLLPGYSSRIEGQGGTTLVGGTVTVDKMFPPDTPVVDFLKGMIEKFNLVFEPLANERNKFVIEPFNDWVDAGDVVDWTDKVDRSVKFEIRHPLQSQSKRIKFTDIEDKDALNVYHTTTFGKVYGEFIYDSDSDLASGEKTIGSFFAPTPQKGIAGAPDMILPNLSQRENNTSTPYNFKPRLLHNLGKRSTSINLRGIDVGGNPNPGYYYIDNGGTPVAWNKYVLFSSLEAVPATFSTTRDLHFGNIVSPGHWPYHQPVANGHAKRSAFYEYWSFYINELYDIDARILTCNVLISPTEIQDIRLNDSIFIDGAYYRINKIAGANLINEDSVEVELLKTLPRKSRFPRRRIVIDDVASDVTVDDATLSISGGNVNYINYNTGTFITSSALVGRAAPKDGFIPFGSESVWNYQRQSRGVETDILNYGNNTVNNSVTTVQVFGDNNNITNGNEQVQILGESNTIGDYGKYNYILGKNNTIEPSISYGVILGGSNAILKGGTIGTGSFNAILNTDEGNILEGRYNTLLGGFGGRIESSSFSTFIGENHYISASDSVVMINTVSPGFQKYFTNMTESAIIQVGKDMDGADYPVEKLYVGDTYFTEEIAEDFFIYTGSLASPLDLDSTTYEGIYSFLLTPSGTGTLEVQLPPCENVTDRGYRRKLKFTIQNRSGADFTFTTQGTDTFYVTGDPTSYDYNFLGGAITFVAAEIAGFGVWVIEEQTRGSKQNEGAYGSFYSTSSQAIITSGSEQLITMGNTFSSQFVNLSGSGAIQMDYKGAYSFIYTAKVENQDNTIHYADFWVKYNGTNYPDSTVRVSIPARKNATDFFAQPVTIQLLDVAINDEDVIELYWRGDSTLLSLNYETFGGTIPAQPSVRAQIHEV